MKLLGRECFLWTLCMIILCLQGTIDASGLDAPRSKAGIFDSRDLKMFHPNGQKNKTNISTHSETQTSIVSDTPATDKSYTLPRNRNRNQDLNIAHSTMGQAATKSMTLTSGIQSTTNAPNVTKDLLNVTAVISTTNTKSPKDISNISSKDVIPQNITSSTTGIDDSVIEASVKDNNVSSIQTSPVPSTPSGGMDAIIPGASKAHSETKHGVFIDGPLFWLSDTYSMSIILPIAAGVCFAVVILSLIAMIICLRRLCRRKPTFRRRSLPEYVKRMSPAERMKLLAGSSDEEF